MKVSEIREILDKWMPISTAEDFDNVGLLVGDLNSEVKNILVTLDTTLNVVDEALDKDCNLIISYHPIIFNGLKKITTDSGYVQKSVIKAVKNNISVYAIHTSLDNHPEGISYFLSKKIGLKKISTLIPKIDNKNNFKIGMGSKGELIEPMEENNFFDLIKNKLELKYLRHSVKLNKKISKVSIVVGSGSFAIKNSLDSNVDAFITSDLKYHNFYEADNKAILVDIGHYESENHIKLIIKEFLNKKLPSFT
ncbi:Nif3-like dinuclear metal center hexameric protein, partial [Flavobacteriaceae bacterium]|nr:Nif3-like dinuclear metal center hexameric protein [Flavobacteriaceae bacterium]